VKLSSSAVFALIITIMAIGAIVIGFGHIDSPSMVRAQRLDNHRLNDLQSIVFDISHYFRIQKHLPKQLQELNISKASLKDIVTNQPYEYKIISGDEYELCAVFDISIDENKNNNSQYNSYKPSCSILLKHEQGKQCFKLSSKSCE
jgi:hypothetical protein